MFSVPDAYDDFMGRWSRLLAPEFAAFADVAPQQRVLDVGCGPGALTEVLGARVGNDRVSASDPSPQFVDACRSRVPGADVREAPAESLPFADASFDVTLAQLVFPFVGDARAGVAEMKRVTTPSGIVATCTWDLENMEMLRVFWDAAVSLDASAPAEGGRTRFGNRDDVEALWRDSDLRDVTVAPIDVTRTYRDFDDYWTPFLAGIGPAGAYCTSLASDARDALRDECRRRIGASNATITLSARAWAVRGRA